MLIKTTFAGFGGQGVLSMGPILAQAAMREDKNVTYLPSYGAEVRGGTANCTVAISDEEIASPVASSPEFIVAMNQPSMVRFQHQLQSGGVFFLNSSLIDAEVMRDDIEVVKLPVNTIAEQLGNPRSANMVMLGAFIKRSNLVKLDTLFEVLKESFSKKVKLVAVNNEALLAGYNLPQLS
ncbi:2-oxoacid:acceptor oxidoreductase family protein [Chloroflexota bacterium]